MRLRKKGHQADHIVTLVAKYACLATMGTKLGEAMKIAMVMSILGVLNDF